MKKISIVFTETGPRDAQGNQAFNVYIEGFPDESRTKKSDDLSAAEFWSQKMFTIVTQLMYQAGAVKTVMRKQ